MEDYGGLKVEHIKRYAQQNGVQIGDILRIHGRDCVVVGLFDWFIRYKWYADPGMFTNKRGWFNGTIHQFDLFKSGAVKLRRTE